MNSEAGHAVTVAQVFTPARERPGGHFGGTQSLCTYFVLIYLSFKQILNTTELI